MRVILVDAGSTGDFSADDTGGKYLPGVDLDSIGPDDIVIGLFAPHGAILLHGPGVDSLSLVRDDWESRRPKTDIAHHALRFTDGFGNPPQGFEGIDPPLSVVHARALRNDVAHVIRDREGNIAAAYCDELAARAEFGEYVGAVQIDEVKLSELPEGITLYKFAHRDGRPS
jgi:hypothetical protein